MSHHATNEPPRMELSPDAAELAVILDDAAMTPQEFARLVRGCHERTIRRWLSGHETIPRSMRLWIGTVHQIEVVERSDGSVDSVTIRYLP